VPASRLATYCFPIRDIWDSGDPKRRDQHVATWRSIWSSPGMRNDPARLQVAHRLLLKASVRNDIFKSKLLRDPAWMMMLNLFVAHVEGWTMTEAHLITLVGGSTRDGQLWLYRLAKDGQVEARLAGTNVTLTETAMVKMAEYLEFAALPA
jgi:hypothetical protein